jgi:hypothetical protein
LIKREAARAGRISRRAMLFFARHSLSLLRKAVFSKAFFNGCLLFSSVWYFVDIELFPYTAGCVPHSV